MIVVCFIRSTSTEVKMQKGIKLTTQNFAQVCCIRDGDRRGEPPSYFECFETNRNGAADNK